MQWHWWCIRTASATHIDVVHVIYVGDDLHHAHMHYASAHGHIHRLEARRLPLSSINEMGKVYAKQTCIAHSRICTKHIHTHMLTSCWIVPTHLLLVCSAPILLAIVRTRVCGETGPCIIIIVKFKYLTCPRPQQNCFSLIQFRYYIYICKRWSSVLFNPEHREREEEKAHNTRSHNQL